MSNVFYAYRSFGLFESPAKLYIDTHLTANKE